MNSTADLPGLRHKFYVSSRTFVHPPSSYSKAFEKPEVRERLLDTYLTRDVPYGYDGQGDELSRLVGSISWQRVNEADSREVERLRAMAGFYDFTDWQPIVEFFSGNGSRVTFTLQRRRALNTLEGSDLPTNAATIFATEVLVAGSPVTPSSWGTVDSKGRQPFTLSSAPASGSRNVEVYYVPLYKVIHRDYSVKYAIPHQEGFALTFEEI